MRSVSEICCRTCKLPADEVLDAAGRVMVCMCRSCGTRWEPPIIPIGEVPVSTEEMQKAAEAVSGVIDRYFYNAALGVFGRSRDI